MIKISLLIASLLFISAGSFAQDSLLAADGAPGIAAGAIVLKPKITTYDYDAMPKDPLASAMLSATLPGTGQIYNKEYLSGAVTVVGFYTSFFLVQYMLGVFENFNMDTTYFEETNQIGTSTGVVRMVRLPKPESEQIWPSTTEKAVFIGSLITTAGFYVWGIYDAYNGAMRYNKKLYSGRFEPFINLAGNGNNAAGLRFNYTF